MYNQLDEEAQRAEQAAIIAEEEARKLEHELQNFPNLQ